MARKFKYGAQSIIYTVVVIAAVVLFDALFSLATENHPLQKDITQSGVFSVSDISKEFYETVDSTIHVYLVLETGFEDTDEIEEIETYCRAFPCIKLHKITPTKEPAFVREHGIALSEKEPLCLVVSSEKTGRSRVIRYTELFSYLYSTKEDNTLAVQSASNTEGVLTAAAEYVLSDKTPKVYYITGHEEEALKSEARKNTFLDQLKNENIDAAPLALLSPVPKDADLIIIPGATTDFGAEELQILDTYMEQGGRLQVYSAPFVSLPNLNEYLNQQWGICLAYDSVAEGDGSRIYQFQTGEVCFNATVNRELENHGAMVEKIKDDDIIIWPYSAFANTVDITENESIEVVPILTTTENATAYLYTDMEAYRMDGAELSPYKETGKQNLVVYGRKNPMYNQNTTARILVAGASEILYTRLDENTYQNHQFLVETINYMTEFEGLTVRVPRKNTADKVFDISTQKIMGQPSFVIYNWLFIVILPLLMIGCAVFISVRRRFM